MTSTRANRDGSESSEAEDHKGAAEVGIISQARSESDGAEAFTRLGQTSGQADRGPSANPGQHRNILFAVVHKGHRIANYS